MDRKTKFLGFTVRPTASHDATAGPIVEHQRRLARERSQNEFLAILAHELRTPLHVILSSAELLVRCGPAEGSAEAAAVSRIQRQTEHLARLVEDLLDVSRVSYGKMNFRPEPLLLDELLARVIDSHRPLAEAKSLLLQLRPAPEPVWVYADRVRLAQVFGNLLDNATKFSPAGGVVELRVLHDAATGKVAVSIRDGGRGIAPERLESIFELFSQADATGSLSVGGLGIGLSVVRSLVALHGGTVTAKSAGEGSGSDFTVTLATHRAAPTPAAPLVQEGRPANAASQERESATDAARMGALPG